MKLLKGLALASDSGSGAFDSLTLARVIVRGPSTVHLGTGGSFVSIEDVRIAAPFLLDAGGGADVVSIERNGTGFASVFSAPVTVLMGEGNDTLNIGANTPSQLVRILAKITLDGGGGGDTINDVAANNFLAPGITPVITNFE